VVKTAGAEAGITIGDLDRVLTELAGTTGTGSVGARAALLDGLLGRAMGRRSTSSGIC